MNTNRVLIKNITLIFFLILFFGIGASTANSKDVKPSKQNEKISYYIYSNMEWQKLEIGKEISGWSLKEENNELVPVQQSKNDSPQHLVLNKEGSLKDVLKCELSTTDKKCKVIDESTFKFTLHPEDGSLSAQPTDSGANAIFITKELSEKKVRFISIDNISSKKSLVGSEISMAIEKGIIKIEGPLENLKKQGEKNNK